MANTIEETLNGGYGGLLWEVVNDDCYKLKELDFIPDTIFDLGCNVGVFSSYARTLFPNAEIIAVEPEDENWTNYFHFFAAQDKNTTLLKKAIGRGEMYRHIKIPNGAHQYFVCEGLGYTRANLETNPDVEKKEIQTVMPDFLVTRYAKGKTLMKIDIEGAETEIFNHYPSMVALKTMDYLAIEIHYHAQDGSLYEGVKQKTLDAMKYFEDTHVCSYVHPIFYATKK